MQVTRFAEKVAAIEAGSKQMTIAQIKELMRVIDDLTDGLLYTIIRWLPLILMLAIAGPKPAYAEETAVVLGGDARVGDTEHVAVHLFDDYNLRETHNHAVGMRFVFKVGKSWETRRLEMVETRMGVMVNAMGDELKKRDAEIGELKFAVKRMEGSNIIKTDKDNRLRKFNQLNPDGSLR